MDEIKPGQIPGPRTAAEYQAEQRMARAMALIAQVPVTFGRQRAEAWIVWAQVVTQLCSKKLLARVVTPWQMQNRIEPKCPPYHSAGKWRRFLRATAGDRVSRGRASNPTAR